MKFLLVIDMQNDFITGSLANQRAQEIMEPISNYIDEFDGEVILTRDTHDFRYLYTREGRYLSIPHCIKWTPGWKIPRAVCKRSDVTYIDKNTFGAANEIANAILSLAGESTIDTIEVVGTVTEICVVSNVLGLKALFPETDFIVHADMCAGLTDEGHNAALTVMAACQIIIFGQ